MQLRGFMWTLGNFASLVAAPTSIGSAAEPAMNPGVYEVEVRIGLPNVQDATAPLVLTRCVRPADIASGRAFSILSENPLKACDILDYAMAADSVSYRIACPGPNRGSAVAVFDLTATTYRGSITMNMGGKNMTMWETQVGKRIANCD